MANSDEWGAPVPQRPPRRWPRRLAKVLGVLAGVLVVLYFVVTCSFFLKAVVLPRAGAALNSKVTAADISLRPFFAVRVNGLKLQPHGSAAPLLALEELSARYSLWDIVRKRFNFQRVTLRGPVIDILEQPDGSSNLDALIKPSETPDEPTEPGAAPQLQLERFELQNATVRRTKIHADGTHERIEVHGLNISLSNLGNGQSAAATIAASLGYSDSLKVQLSGDINCGLTPELKPDRIQAKISVRTTHAEKNFATLAGAAAELNCQLSPAELEEFSLAIARADKALARLAANGPFDLARRQGRVKVSLAGVDRELLNVFGAPAGLDFAGTTLSSEHVIEFGEAERIAAQGDLKLNQVTLARNGLGNKPIDVVLQYGAALNRAEKSAVIERLSLAGPGINGGLQQPVNISFADPPVVSDSQFTLTVTNLSLADWPNFITNAHGQAQLLLRARAEQSGKKLVADLQASLTNLTAQFGSSRFDRLSIALDVAGASVRDFASVDLPACELRLVPDGAEAILLTASGAGNLKAQAADLKVEAVVPLPAVPRLIQQPGINIGSGALKLAARLQQNAAGATVQGSLDVLNLRASIGSLAINDFETVLAWDAALQTNVARLTKLDCAFRQRGTNAGALTGSGRYSLSNGAAAANFAINGLNETVLQMFLPTGVLRAITVGGTLTAAHDPHKESAVRADLRIANLRWWGERPREPMDLDLKLDAGLQETRAVLRQFTTVFQGNGTLNVRGTYHLTNKSAHAQLTLKDINQNAFAAFAPDVSSALLQGELAAAYDPKGQSTVKGTVACSNLVLRGSREKPLALALNLDGALSNHVVNLQTFKLNLDPTARARNELSLWGHLNIAQPEAIQGNLELSAASLDLAPYQKMLASDVPSRSAPAPGASAGAPAGTKSPQEPSAVNLPFRDFAFHAAIDRLFLQDHALEECLAKLRLNQGRIQVQPLKFAVNGAPANLEADVNLGVPGFRYDLTLLANKLPLEPLLREEKFKGALAANIKLRGAGVTPPSLRSNLNGGLEVQLSDAQIQAGVPFLRTLLVPVALFLRAPELTNTPLSSAAIVAQVGSGRVEVSKLNLASQTYIFDTQGNLVLDNVLENSAFQRWPLHLQLSRSIAQRINLASRATAADAAYVKTPDFLRLAGTVSDPKPEINPAGIAGTVLEKLSDRLLPQTPRAPRLFP